MNTINTSAKHARLNLTNKVLLLFALIVILQSAFLALIFCLLEDSERLLEKHRHARQIVAATAKFSADLQATTVLMLNQIQFQNLRNETYRDIISKVPKDVQVLKELLKDNPDTKSQLNELETSVYEAIKLAEKMPDSARDTATEKKMLHDLYGIQLVDLSHAMTSSIDDLEGKYKLLMESNGVTLASQSDNLFYITLIVGFITNTLVALALYYFVVNGITNKLTILARNMINLSMGKPLLAPLQGNDELADLDVNFRAMAKNLEGFRTKEATILEHAANFICSLNSKEIFASVPAASSALWGYAPDELLGRRFNTIVNSDSIEPTAQALKSVVTANKSVTFENQVRCRDGSLVDLSWTANLNEAEDIICIAHNITERTRVTNLIRKSDERFRAIVEHMPVAVFGCDQSFVIESINAATTTMLRCTSEELIGKQLDQMLRISSMPLLKHTVQLNVPRKDETRLPIEFTLDSYSTTHGEKYLACLRDVSARIEIELAKRDFISMISHDLRSPLMSLLGTLSMIEGEHGSSSSPIDSPYNQVASEKEDAVPDGKKGFAKAEVIVERLVDFINDFLDLGKIEANPESLQRFDTRLELVFSHVWQLAEEASKASNCEIILPDLPNDPFVQVDLERIALAFACLVEITMYCNPGIPSVAISTTLPLETTQVLPSVVISIACPRGQLPQEVKELCVEGYSLIYFNSHISSSGLLLALSRAIIGAHNGSLSVLESELGESFEVVLPLKVT